MTTLATPAPRWEAAGPHWPAAPPPIDPAAHLGWARGIARGVRHRYGFLRGSQEERDLESTASLVVCEYAPRFDPALSFKRSCGAAIGSACRSWRPGVRVSPVWACVPFCGLDYGPWAIRLARRAIGRRGMRSGNPGRVALVRLALGITADRARRFDPIGAFRGWCAVEVRGRCQRHAVTLRNGGTFRTCARLDWGWQVSALPGTDERPDDTEDAGGSERDGDVPRQLQVRDAEYDEDALWYEIWLRWCLEMTRARRRASGG